MSKKTHKWKATARVSFPYHFEPLIFETEDEARKDTKKDIMQGISGIVDQEEIEICDLRIENLGPCEA